MRQDRIGASPSKIVVAGPSNTEFTLTYRRYAPLAAPIAGTVEADLGIVGSFAGPLEFTARGTARVAGFALGPPERPPVTVKDAEATDPDRLVAAEAPAAPGGPGEGRIEFEIRPAA